MNAIRIILPAALVLLVASVAQPARAQEFFGPPQFAPEHPEPADDIQDADVPADDDGGEDAGDRQENDGAQDAGEPADDDGVQDGGEQADDDGTQDTEAHDDGAQGVQEPPFFFDMQDAEPPATGPPAELYLNFRDAPLDAVLDYLSESAGLIVVKTVEVDGRITLLSRQPVTSGEIIGLLNTILKERGYMAVVMGRTLRILPLAEARRTYVPVRSGNDPSAIEMSDNFITQVIPLRYVDATRLRQDISTLIPAYADLSANANSNTLILTDTEANVRRIVEIVRVLDAHLGTVAEVRVFPLEYANASNAARLINEIFREDQPTQQQQAGPGAWGGRRFRTETESTSDAGFSQKIVASADDRTNTVVVSGPPDILAVVEKVINDLDSNPTSEQAVFHYPLKNAKAANLETILNNLFQQTTTTQGGATGRTRGQTAQRQQVSTAAADAAAGLAGQVHVVADADTNTLMVMTAQKNFEQVRAIIAELDRPVPQVLIKVLIAEVTRSNKSDIGVEFSALNLKGGNGHFNVFTEFPATTTGGLDIVHRLVERDVTTALSLLEEVGKLDVLSRPYILASDNQPATITVGQTVPFIRNTRLTETGQTINTIEYEDIGIILSVTPHINPQGLVILDVSPEISTLTGDTVPISENVFAPVFAKRSASSRVAIHNGQTIVIGGLMEDKKTDTIRKVPILGDIPLMGALFRRKVQELTKTELLIFLTPHVAQQPDALEGLSEEEIFSSKIIPGAVAPGAFEEHMQGLQRGAGMNVGGEE